MKTILRKQKCKESVSLSVVSDSLRPHGLQPPGPSVHGILQTRKLKWVAIPTTGDLPDPGIKSGSPALQVDSLPSKPSGKPQLPHKSNKTAILKYSIPKEV